MTRMIDADAIDYDEFWNRNGEGFSIIVCQKAQQIIDEQPTIYINLTSEPSISAEAMCEVCANLEKGDTLYSSSDWDGGIGFDYIYDIQFCPKCGRKLW